MKAPTPCGRLSFITNGTDGNFTSMDTISIEDAKRLMQQVDERGNYMPFSFTAVTLDLERKTGGDIVTYESAVLTNMSHTHILVQHPGSSQIRKYRIILITHINGKEVTA